MQEQHDFGGEPICSKCGCWGPDGGDKNPCVPDPMTILKTALAFYADPDTYEQIESLGQCPLAGDSDQYYNFGKRAREALERVRVLNQQAAPAAGKGER